MSHSLFDIPAAAGSPDIAPPHPLWEKIRDALGALSLANLCFISAWLPLCRSERVSYYNKLPLTSATLVAMMINIIWLAVLIWLVIRALRRFRNRWFHLACEWLFLLLCLLPLHFLRAQVWGIRASDILVFLKRPLPAASVLMLLIFIVWKRRWVVCWAAAAVGILSPLALFTFANIAIAGLSPNNYLPDPPLPPLGFVLPSQPRVVWIIFDETDQRLVFEQRPANLPLPAFDRLRRDSLYATNAFPPGANTLRSIPGLISGCRVSEAKPNGTSELMLTLADNGGVVAWSDLPSVFASARELGINTALVGFWHPYSRVLGRSLNYCAWYPWPAFEQVRARTVGAAMWREIASLESGPLYRRMYIQMCRAMVADSLSVVTNANYGLIFLHLPLPHFPGVFNAATGKWSAEEMSVVDGYFNNLVLADRTLGQLRQAMEASRLWDKSWLIVSSDHSWRSSPSYDGRRDYRIPFLIKAPGAAQSNTCPTPINTSLTRDLVLAILRGNLTNQQQTAAWLEAHPSAQPLAASHTGSH